MNAPRTVINEAIVKRRADQHGRRREAGTGVAAGFWRIDTPAVPNWPAHPERG